MTWRISKTLKKAGYLDKTELRNDSWPNLLVGKRWLSVWLQWTWQLLVTFWSGSNENMLRLAACLRLLRLSRAVPRRSAFPSQAWDGPSLESGLRLLAPLRVCCSDVLRPQLTRDEFPLSPQTSCDTRLMSAWESREETFWKVFLSCLPVCTFRYLL